MDTFLDRMTLVTKEDDQKMELSKIVRRFVVVGHFFFPDSDFSIRENLSHLSPVSKEDTCMYHNVSSIGPPNLNIHIRSAKVGVGL